MVPDQCEAAGGQRGFRDHTVATSVISHSRRPAAAAQEVGF